MTYLVIARCPMDDVPLRCYTNQRTAVRYARKSTPDRFWKDLVENCKVGGWDFPSEIFYVIIMQFSPKGKPIDSWQERDMSSEPPPQAIPIWKPRRGKRN